MKKSMLFVVAFSSVFLSCLANASNENANNKHKKFDEWGFFEKLFYDEGGYFAKLDEERNQECGHLAQALRGLTGEDSRWLELSREHTRCVVGARIKFDKKYQTVIICYFFGGPQSEIQTQESKLQSLSMFCLPLQ